MQKKKVGMHKLTLSKETLRSLQESELARAGGGNEPVAAETENRRFTGYPCIVVYCA